MNANHFKSAGNSRRASKQDVEENIFDGIYMKFISMMPMERPKPSEPSPTRQTRNGSVSKYEPPSPLSSRSCRPTHFVSDMNDKIMVPALDSLEKDVIKNAVVSIGQHNDTGNDNLEHEKIEINSPMRDHFESKLKQRSKSWMYDWLMDLKDTENPDGVKHSLRNWWNSTGLESPAKIREELHSLQTLMVQFHGDC